ncbi:MAG: abortive infection family protein [Melioribacteraceae bacterium]|nr:MAG: abortive infection family protein [Melioribacteraceae bacterium]
MSELKYIDRLKFEKIFGMGGGYVMDFTNRTFRDFIYQTIDKDIYDDKYEGFSGSKANRLRKFWEVESNYLAAKLNSNLLEYWKSLNIAPDKELNDLYEECLRVCEELKQDSMDEHIGAIKPNTEDKDFSTLANLIRDSIEKNEPETAIDRLHTFVVKYIRSLCNKHSINYDKNKALHSFYGEYVKHLRAENKIESEMTERILKTSISILEAFNTVRNDQSFAHDNPILNYNESLLIFKNIACVIEFLESIERDDKKEDEDNKDIFVDDDLPF